MNCAYDLSEAPVNVVSETAPTVAWPAPQFGCPSCGAPLGPSATFCGNCGATVRAGSNARKYIIIGAVAFLVLALAGAAVWYFFLSGPSISVSFDEKLLATIPSDYNVEDYEIEFSPDGSRVAYIAKKQGASKEFVVSDGKPGKEYDQIRSLTFSVDSGRIAYLAKDGTNTLIVVNGEEKMIDYGFDDVRLLTINPNNNGVEYLVKSGNRSYIVVGDKRKDSAYDEIDGFGYTLNGNLVCLAKNSGSEARALLINDKVVAESRDIDVDLSPDGKTIVYAVEEKNKKSYIVIGDKKLEGYDRIRRPIYSPGGGGYLVVASKDGKDYLIKNGKEEPMPDDLKGKNLIAMSADGSRIAYEESDAGKYRIVVGDKRSETFDLIMSRSVVFSPDGSKLAFVANATKTSPAPATGTTSVPSTKSVNVVVVGDQKSEEFDEVYALPFGRLNFNSGGSKVAFGARKGNDIWWKVMDVK